VTAPARLDVIVTEALSAADRRALRALLDEAFAGDLSDDDWAHALGGWHAIAREIGAIVAHAAVVPRRIEIDGRLFHAGYVEAVATAPSHQRRGFGTAVMRAIAGEVRTRFELGVLSSGTWGFYERLGWERWRGPTWVRAADGERRRSPEEDDGVMVLRTTASHDVDLGAAITCEARAGDAW
jgi:aminoglycoside 2'-N-acetyltransferase I